MPMLSIKTAVTHRQTDYKAFKRSLTDALGLPMSRNWPSSSHHHQMKRIYSHVNTRTRRKRLFEPKEKEGGSEK